MEKSKIKNQKSKLEFLHFALSFSILIFTFSILPLFALASNIYIDTTHQDFFVGDTVMFSVRVDSEDRDINAVEGIVMLNNLTESGSLVDINTAGSVFSLWPGKPSPSENNTNISFAGGTPLGLSSKDAVIFNFVLKLEEVGSIILAPSNLSVYLNDGKGTRDTINAQNLTINVLSPETSYKPTNDLGTLISEDKTPPKSFKIIVGQDGSVFDGQKFLSFGTIDEQSGIKYYEVREGGLPPVRSDGTYVLQNQDKRTKVTVVAYDAAGNARESVYNPRSLFNNLSRILVVVVILLMIVFVIKSKIKNRRSK